MTDSIVDTERAPDAPAEDEPRPRYLLAALTVGGAAVHFAMVPIHAGDDALHGLVFVVGAWAQIIAAGALLLRGDRRSLLLAAVVNIATIIAWIVSRTLGLPLGAHAGHPESITIVDGATTAMEVLAVLGAAALLARPGRVGKPMPVAITAAACTAVMVATGGVLIHEDARGHAHGTHGATEPDGHDHGDMTDMPSGHDHGDMPTGTTMPMHDDGHAHDHGDVPDMPEHDMTDMPEHDMTDMPADTTMPMHDDGHAHDHGPAATTTTAP